MAIAYITRNAQELEAEKEAAQSRAFFVEAGDYKLKVIEASESKSDVGNPMIKLKLRVILPGGSDGPSLFDYLVFNANSKWKVDAFLKSSGQYPGDGEEAALDADDMIGWECAATLKVEEYKGNKNNKVVAYLVDEFA